MYGLVLAFILTVGNTAVTAETETTWETELQQDTEPFTDTELSDGETEEEETETQNWLDQADEWMEQEEWEGDIDFWEVNEEETDGFAEEMMETEEYPAEPETISTERESEIKNAQLSDINNYLPVQFYGGTSSLEWFPKEVKIAKVVQNGYPMTEIAPKSTGETGKVGAYYRKVVRQGEKWYDLKMTLTESESEEVISKEGTMNVQNGISFCTERIGWGIHGKQGRTVLKMEFVESGTDIPAAINTRFLWKNPASGDYPQVTPEDGSFGARYYPEDRQKDSNGIYFLLDKCSTWYMTWENKENNFAAVICQEDILPGRPEREMQPEKEKSTTEKIIRWDASVRLFVSHRDPVTKQWIKDTVFEVYEWNGYEYGIYRGCLTYIEEKNVYTMNHLVRNEVNQGKYKIVKVSESGSGPPGWEQEVLVQEMPVVTDLYYHVEEGT